MAAVSMRTRLKRVLVGKDAWVSLIISDSSWKAEFSGNSAGVDVTLPGLQAR
ncbi:hypothetical protein P7K49_013342 [Saguinus oedipus]|uniref:Uncharacterized protein n=1 Tax=Saguinus oedipus TaxID=9490 RepID=A0ABQ9VG11_SAGOE|nr:hypothetical protein P7K49_013342 [Saguinus oedipus]